MILFITDVPGFRPFFVISCHVKSNWCLRPIITSLMVQSSPPPGASWWCTLCGTWSAPPGSSQTEKLIGHISFHPDLWLWKEEISAQAHRQTVEEIIAGSRRWNRVRSFLNSGDIVLYVIAEPSNQRLESGGQPSERAWRTAQTRGRRLRRQWRQKLRANWTEMFAPSWILNPQPPHIFHQSTEST